MQFVLLGVAAACQVLVIFICIGGFVELISCLNDSKNEPVASSARTVIGLPGVIAVVLQATVLNCGLLVLWFPEIWKSESARGGLFLAAIGFGCLALSSFATLMVFKSRVAIVQLGLSLIGLTCLFSTPYL
jgi:hypothetical protein